MLADAPLTLALGRAEPARRAWVQETMRAAASRRVVVAHLPEPASGEVLGGVIADAIARSASNSNGQVLILIERAQELDQPLLVVLARLLESDGARAGRLRVVLVGTPALLDRAPAMATAAQIVATDQPATAANAWRRIGMLAACAAVPVVAGGLYATAPLLATRPHAAAPGLPPDHAPPYHAPPDYAEPGPPPVDPDRGRPLTGFRADVPAPQTEPAPRGTTAPVAATAPPAPAPRRPGLLLQVRPGDTLESLYARVYRGLTAPPLADVAALNPGPIKPGDVLSFPPPQEGWSRVPSLGSADR